MFTAQTTWAMSAITSASDSVPLGVDTMVVASQSGRFSGTRFWKNDLPPAPSGKRCSSTGRPPIAPQDRLLDREVVVDEVELGVAPLGEEHLVGAGHRQLVAGQLEGDGDLLAHGRTVPPGASAGWPSRRLTSTAPASTTTIPTIDSQSMTSSRRVTPSSSEIGGMR